MDSETVKSTYGYELNAIIRKGNVKIYTMVAWRPSLGYSKKYVTIPVGNYLFISLCCLYLDIIGGLW